MSTIDDKLLRYKILNRCFRNIFREYTIDDLVEEVNKALEQAYDKSAQISKRTIQDDLALLQLPPYSAVFDEKLKKGRKRLYRYRNPSFTLPMFRMNDNERNKINEAISVLEDFDGEPLYDWARSFLIQVAGGQLTDEMKSVVSFQSNPDLKGLEHFGKLHQSILSQKVIKLTYTPYDKATFTVNVYPYHLKQFNNRWYLITKNVGRDTITPYALDRIEGFTEVAIKYKESDIDFEEYYDDVIGVTVPEHTEPVDVLLRVDNKRYNYIRTKPLHLSQRIVSKDKDTTTISINVKINKELIAQILSYDSDIEVLAPQSFREEIIQKILAMQEKYKL